MQSNDVVPYEFKTKPFTHQLDEWHVSRDLVARAIFWEQGTGKSKLIVDTVCWLWLHRLIDAVVVVAPNGVHRNWVEQEIPDHSPDFAMSDSMAFHFQSPKSSTKWHKKAVQQILRHDGLAWFTIGYEGFMTATGKRSLIDFFDKRRVFYVLDESHSIKNPDAERTKSILLSGKYAAYRRVLTGTPISQGPFDAYSQIKFLVENYWKDAQLSTFTEFKTHFGIFTKMYNPNLKRQFNKETGEWKRCDGGYVDVVSGYRRLDELNSLLAPISTRVTKDDVLDLPPKLFNKRYFSMSPEQAKLYREMKDEYMVWLTMGGIEHDVDQLGPQMELPGFSTCQTCGGAKEIESDGFIYTCPDCWESSASFEDGDTLVAATLALTRLLRLQQITSGYLPTEDEEEPMYIIPGKNNRLDLLVDIVEQSQHKVIVWARFQLDITLILDRLKELGIPAARYDGLASEEERAETKARFQGERALYENGMVVGREAVPEEEQVKVFVGNPAAGASGLTLTQGKTVVYYSNSFKLIDRLQSEDRAHRIGQDNQVLYLDLMAEGTVDEQIVEALRNKFNIARQITGDRLKDWL